MSFFKKNFNSHDHWPWLRPRRYWPWPWPRTCCPWIHPWSSADYVSNALRLEHRVLCHRPRLNQGWTGRMYTSGTGGLWHRERWLKLNARSFSNKPIQLLSMPVRWKLSGCCTAKSAGHACKVHKRVYTTANSLLSTSTMTNEQGARDEMNCWIFVLWRPKEKSSFITVSLRDKTDIVVRVEIRENLHDVYRRLHYWRKINNMDKSSATA